MDTQRLCKIACHCVWSLANREVSVASRQELGVYKYKLRLKATAPSTTPVLSFEAPLGSSQVETFT